MTGFSVEFQPGVGERNEVAPPKKLQFTYTNHRGDEYVYVIAPEKLELGPFHNSGMDPSDGAKQRWALHGDVWTRDADRRSDMGTRRRTFMLDGIRDPKWVDAS